MKEIKNVGDLIGSLSLGLDFLGDHENYPISDEDKRLLIELLRDRGNCTVLGYAQADALRKCGYDI